MDLSEQMLGIPRNFVDLSEQIHEIVRINSVSPDNNIAQKAGMSPVSALDFQPSSMCDEALRHRCCNNEPCAVLL